MNLPLSSIKIHFDKFCMQHQCLLYTVLNMTMFYGAYITVHTIYIYLSFQLESMADVMVQTFLYQEMEAAAAL